MGKKSKRNSCIVSVEPSISSSPVKRRVKTIENVLGLQGRGSLRAFGCRVFNAPAKENIKIDIVAGTSRARFI